MSDLILSAKDFKTLSSETRVQIIKLLASRNYNLTELSGKLKLAMPSIKQHIDVLLDGGLIEQVDSTHKWKYYNLSKKGRKLVEPYSSQVLIVLSSSLIGILGIALIASAVLGLGSSMLLTSGASAPNVSSIGANAPVIADGIQKAMVSNSSVSSETTAGTAVKNGARAALPAFDYYPLAAVIIGALLLAFAVLVVKRKTVLFR